jgi:hypothetical protein
VPIVTGLAEAASVGGVVWVGSSGNELPSGFGMVVGDGGRFSARSLMRAVIRVTNALRILT